MAPVASLTAMAASGRAFKLPTPCAPAEPPIAADDLTAVFPMPCVETFCPILADGRRVTLTAAPRPPRMPSIDAPVLGGPLSNLPDAVSTAPKMTDAAALLLPAAVTF